MSPKYTDENVRQLQGTMMLSCWPSFASKVDVRVGASPWHCVPLYLLPRARIILLSYLA